MYQVVHAPGAVSFVAPAASRVPTLHPYIGVVSSACAVQPVPPPVVVPRPAAVVCSTSILQSPTPGTPSDWLTSDGSPTSPTPSLRPNLRIALPAAVTVATPTTATSAQAQSVGSSSPVMARFAAIPAPAVPATKTVGQNVCPAVGKTAAADSLDDSAISDAAARQSAKDGRHVGTVVCFGFKRGFGFIESPSAKAQYGRQVFVHHSGVRKICIGCVVEFSVELSAKGPLARGLRVLYSPSARKETGEAPLSQSAKYSGDGQGADADDASQISDAQSWIPDLIDEGAAEHAPVAE
eukprot:TRINITY_DN66402_c0_g1_i1.p1 TRINITY_DN66402_c0_g1~~TRINITY_DN66402_c0_g1_i1.p1  ORF type:complete len:295 (+),score=66.19 TRINITY_DN66402_c0_g1_i1:106-990(+)